ncbi:Piso0_000426 [Millerozyma farinosa CBS 7064]|uniref:Multiple RNA-binding domain-containing protein 1 n=1 Tax=Pichia sorbitophila (strain ATCC MYA-4447 / BCRC 22081 / CBS 7064 / NBRC 10061 / NRRL Y-12695) TaxID=559304 RepID=G8YVE7_PICSO|nr:Piso0_000426 [Millerozyma farinosa CBS 7064]CCE73391.1 Piso0_000426 [Millerozyma farinosa CBS 7064]
MSRIIVKGLPKYLTEERLRQHFSQRGDVTDVKIMRKRDGESRRFGFVGYRGVEDASDAEKFFNKSFIDTSRIEVELAKSFADPNVPASVRKRQYMKLESLKEQEQRLFELENQRKEKKQKTSKSQIDEEIQKNPQLREYMEVMKPSSQSRSWDNNETVDGSGAPSTEALAEALKGKSGEPSTQTNNTLSIDRESDDEYEDYNRINGASAEADDDESDKFLNLDTFAPKPDGEDNVENEQETSDQAARDPNVSDLEWLKSHRRHMRDNENDASQEEPPKAAEQDQEESYMEEKTDEEKAVDRIRETGRLFVRNILYTSKEEDFKALFDQYGPLEEVHMAIDTRTGKPKGYVYVQFKNSEDALEAYRSMDKQIFQGRLLHILPADAKKSHRLDEDDIKNLPLKKQRELKRKATAGKSQFSWNSLYMNTDAVLESVAAKMGMSKSSIIDPQNSSSAVKQALAEADVIGDVRKYFESKYVDLTSFSRKERDDRVILVKNFPFGTSSSELGELFSVYGQLNRILMPPAGTIAIVQFRDVPSARAAFSKLAYKRFKKSILYLEKGPKDLFTREVSEEESEKLEKKDNVVEPKLTADDLMVAEGNNGDAINEVDTYEGPTVSVFVKNLNFATTNEALSNAFKSVPGFILALVKTKPDPKKPDSTLSMGFGFVEFKTKEDANTAIKTMDGYVLDGHKLQLKLSNRQGGSGKNETKTKSSKSSKIIIKNLPFETTRKDIVELFGAFGQIKSARVPKKFDRSARGFAFVEFNLLKEAENAIEQLQGVHLLGRRLVMQYAEQDSSDPEAEIEKLTRKVKKQTETRDLAAARLASKGASIDLEESNDPSEDFS